MKKIVHTFCKFELVPHVYDFFLLGAVFVFSLLRIPSLIEPEWYGDEGIYQVIGVALNKGNLLYRDIWDNKPPVLYVYYAMVNGDLFAIKLLSLLFGIAAVVVFFYLAKRLFQNRKLPVFLSTSIFVYLFGTPIFEGNVANAENFMLFPILLSLFLITRLTGKSSLFIPMLSGFLLSLAFLTKIVAVFDLCAFMLALFCIRYYNKNLFDIKRHVVNSPKIFLSTLKQEIILLISFIIPILLTWIYFILMGVSFDFLRATFSNNIGYVGWKNYLNLQLGNFQVAIPQGYLIIKLILLFASAILLVIFRKKFSVVSLVIYSWLIFSIFNTFFSGRPYTHYVLTLVPAVSLLVGLVFINKKRALFHLFVLMFICFLVSQNFDKYNKIRAYYMNYIDFVVSERSVTAYQRFFDSDTPKNYEIAEFIKKNTSESENVFMVSNSSTIYYMAGKLPPGRYIVAYHIESFPEAIEETKKALQVKQPKYIISTNDKLVKEFIDGYTLQYILHDVKIYEKQF